MFCGDIFVLSLMLYMLYLLRVLMFFFILCSRMLLILHCMPMSYVIQVLCWRLIVLELESMSFNCVRFLLYIFSSFLLWFNIWYLYDITYLSFMILFVTVWMRYWLLTHYKQNLFDMCYKIKEYLQNTISPI